jgi:hypothetical protein
MECALESDLFSSSSAVLFLNHMLNKLYILFFYLELEQ